LNANETKPAKLKKKPTNNSTSVRESEPTTKKKKCAAEKTSKPAAGKTSKPNAARKKPKVGKMRMAKSKSIKKEKETIQLEMCQVTGARTRGQTKKKLLIKVEV
jgi:hypothetical protein